MEPVKAPEPIKPTSSLVKKRNLIVPALSIVIIIIAGILLYSASSSTKEGVLLASVNGEPIYSETVEATLTLLPPELRTDEERSKILNQTIDLVILKQEASRRKLSVDDRSVDIRIEQILNDTGKSPSELRLMLADKNVTPQDFRETIRDMLLVEKLVDTAITSKISVSEQEINDYYKDHEEDFLPPEKAVRVSHIFVEDKDLAIEIIKKLNEGQSFRSLAENYSLDTESASVGGYIGIIAPDSDVDRNIRNTALSLRENQYTKTPVQSGNGWHVLMRNFDLLSVQQVRGIILDKLKIEKQRSSFTSLLDGLRNSADIRLYTAQGVVSKPKAPSQSTSAFLACVSTKATLYVAPWSEASTGQLALFSDTTLLSIVDCDKEQDVCLNAKIEKYPTWIINGKSFGVLTVEQLGEKTDCTLPN